MRIICTIFILIFSSSLLVGQYGAAVDSLEQKLATIDRTDTNYVLVLVDLWRASSGNDLVRADKYARRIIERSRAQAYLTGLATGYQRLGITQAKAGLIDSSMFNYRRALGIYERENMVGLQGVMLYNIGGNYLGATRYDSAYYYLELAAACFARGGNSQRRGAVYLSLSQIDREQQRYASSLEKALQAREFFIEAQDSIWLADAETEIGFANLKLEDYSASLASFQKAADIYAAFNDDYYRQTARISQANLHHLMGNSRHSLALLDSILLETKAAGFKPLLIEALGVLALMEKEQGLDERAILHFEELLASSDPVDDLSARLQAQVHLSELLIDNNQLDKAEELVQALLPVLQERELLEFEQIAQRTLATVAAKKRDYRLAYYLRLRYTELNDSLRSRENRDRLAEVEARFQHQEQQLEIERQAARLEMVERERQLERLQQRVWMLGLVGVALLLALLAYSFRQRYHSSQLEKKNEKLRLEYQLHKQQKELSVQTLHLLQKSQVLDQLRVQLEQVNFKNGKQSSIDRMLRDLQNDELTEQDWQLFKTYFNEVHGSFENKLRTHTNGIKLSPRELRMAALIRTGLNNQEISSLLRMSQDSLYKAKYRLKKKLLIAEEQGLDDYIQSL
ncbi:MAG: hypothetical protein AAFU03_01770 [Bacteroidota bacterium]